MKTHHLSILLTCAFLTAQAPLPEALPEVLPRGWRRTDDAVVGAPHAALLGRGVTLRAPDARVEVELSLADATSTAASLVIGGSHVGFCGRDGEPFLEGPLFGGGTRRLDAPKPAAGAPF